MSVVNEPEVRSYQPEDVLCVARMKNLCFLLTPLASGKKLPAMWTKNILMVSNPNTHTGCSKPRWGQVVKDGFVIH